MEIPIKNAFISKEIKKDKLFCERYKRNHRNFSLTHRNEFIGSNLKDLKHNYNFRDCYSKESMKTNGFNKMRNISELSLLRTKKIGITNITNLSNRFLNNISFHRIINNKNNKYNRYKYDILKNKFNYLHKTVSNDKINSNNKIIFPKKDEKTIVNNSLNKNNEKKGNTLFDLSSSFNGRIMNFQKKKHSINRYNIHQRIMDYQKHKKLLVKLNSINASSIFTDKTRIFNLQKIKNFKKKYEEKYTKLKKIIKL